MPSTTRPRPRKKNAAAQALGRLGGQAGTAAQNRARKHNAQYGGRPRRVCNDCGQPVLGGHKDARLDATCGQHGWHWQKRADAPPDVVRPDPTADLLRDLITVFDDASPLPSTGERKHLIARLRAAVRLL